jgi:glutathione S-transferase
MIEVHHLNNSRSQRVLWLLEELGTPYSIVFYQRDAKTRLAPAELKAIHPLGKSPVIRDGEQVIAESGAIMEYLAERANRLIPARNSQAYESFRYWMHYAEGSLMPPLLIKLYLGMAGDGAKPVIDRVDSNVHTHLDFIEATLGASAYLAGNDITAADLQLSFPMEVIATQGLLNAHPKSSEWLRALHSRPAYQRALEKGGPYAYAQRD